VNSRTNLIDPRTVHALEIAADAGQFARCRTPSGELVWAIPSQSRAGVRYLVSEHSCQCQDFRRNGLRPGRIGFYGSHFTCKHVRALQILLSAWTAQQTEHEADMVLEQLPSGEFAWLRVTKEKEYAF
jgi:hypothetical protein